MATVVEHEAALTLTICPSVHSVTRTSAWVANRSDGSDPISTMTEEPFLVFYSVILPFECILPGGLVDQENLIASLPSTRAVARDSDAAPTERSGDVGGRGDAAGEVGCAHEVLACAVAGVAAADVDVVEHDGAHEHAFPELGDLFHPGVQ